VFYIGFAITDAMAVGGEALQRILMARLGVAALGLTVAVLAERYWRALVNGVLPTLVMAIAMVALLLVTLNRPYEIGWHGMSMMVMLLATYVFIPNRFMPAAIIAILASLGFVWLAQSHFQPGTQQIVYLIALLLALNILGAMTAYRISRMQHEAYLDATVLKAANDALQREMTQRRNLESDLRLMLEHDSLTGLPNRARFLAHAQELIDEVARDGGSLCLLVLDVDYFRQLNASFGHSRCDEILLRMAQHCQGFVRERQLCARLGGDDFAFIMPDTDIEAASRRAEEMRLDIKTAAIDMQDAGVRFTVSLGVAAWLPGESLNALLRRADHALSLAKYKGRDRVEVAPEGQGNGAAAPGHLS
jgi:diguanylate cyclase (GGDEF)-like protein